MSNSQSFARKVEEARVSAGYLSRNSFAKAVGVSTTAIEKIEKGQSQNPARKTLLRIAEVSGRPLEWFYGDSEPQSLDINSILTQVEALKKSLSTALSEVSRLEAALRGSAPPSDIYGILEE